MGFFSSVSIWFLSHSFLLCGSKTLSGHTLCLLICLREKRGKLIRFLITKRKGSHFINVLKGWWVSVSLPLVYFPHPSSSPQPTPPPPFSTVPIGLSCCCNVIVDLWTSDANLCFALALCLLLVVVHILSIPPSHFLSSLHPSIRPCLTCNDLFHAFLIFILPPPPITLLPFPPSPLSFLV